MKKIVLALIVGLTVFATASIAAAEVTVGGELEVRYDLWNNLDLNTDATYGNSFGEARKVNTQTFFADRILLNVDAKIAEGLEAYVELATDNGDIINDEFGDERVFGFDHTNVFGAKASGSFVNYQGENLAVKQAWVNFMIPGIPVGVKIGHQPLALGHGIFLDTHRMGTDAILVYSKPVDSLLVAGVFAKVVEQSTSIPGAMTGNEHSDADYWAGLANYTFMPGNTAGVHYSFIDDASALHSVRHTHNIGLTADGVVGPANYKFEADYVTASSDVAGETVSNGHGYAAMIGVGAKVAIVNVGMEVAYGSGTSVNKTPGTRTYTTPYGTTSYNYAFLYNDKIGQGPSGTGSGMGLGDGTGGFGLENTGYVKLSASVNPMDKLNAGLDVLYLRASNELFHGQKRTLGWEVDAHADYKIYDNLNLNVTGGVFLPGDFYEIYGTDDTSYGVETKLTCKF